MASVEDLIEAGEPLLQAALQAMRRHNAAKGADAPAEEVERPRLQAETLFRQLSEYQMTSLRNSMHILH